MKYLLLLLISLGVHAQVQPLSEQEQIDQMSVDNSIYSLINRLDQDCRFEIAPKNQIDDPECTPNPNLPEEIVQCKMDDPADLSTSYDRLVIKDVEWLNCQAGTVRNRQQLNCAKVMLPSCPTPELADLEAELPVAKAERQANLDRSNMLKRLQAVSKNNSAYFKVYGAISWGYKNREISNLPTDQMEIEVVKLENALILIQQEEADRKAAEAARKARVEELKAKEGLTLAEMEELLKKM